MAAIFTEISIILLLILVNGIFASSEMAIVSSRKVRLEHLANQGKGAARTALKLAKSPNNFLSTVQIGITLIGILNGAVAGATIVERLNSWLGAIPFLHSRSHSLSVILVVGGITYVTLVLGELVPKRIALHSPERIACAIAPPMRFLAKLTAPVVHLLSVSTELLLRLLGIQESQEPTVTEEEIKVMIRQGTQLGVFETSEQEMVERVFRLGDRSIKSLMTPRTEITWLNTESTTEENIAIVTSSPNSRFPVGRESLEHCLGIVRGSHVLAACLANADFKLESLIQPPLYISESTRALRVLEQFQTTGMHIALITNEYGAIEGLVTLNDLMEGIVGDLPSAESQDEPMVVERSDGSWLLDGLLAIEELQALLQLGPLPLDHVGEYHTLGGFIMYSLGCVPQTGDMFQWSGFQFEVVDMDGTRVDKVLTTRLPGTELENGVESEN
ncbi:hemolysin family protein [Candidatus Synechococcus calcipolaris G9]|uniref:Hemolysin family protein n=1 Tax=Candidatus Synechococcus calcipolaris G9 TaxID=1497997 RepID=A0ABT6F1S1_9SYNE|nr:hemolysin family protein [Candidatus Synechococcus calcipolaris]MDG2991789.1 hemolysin family protein [Candidatus Synechococcus calcipolaris G9]